MLIRKKWWDCSLAQEEFTYNIVRHNTINKSSFENIYLQFPRYMLDLVPIQKSARYSVVGEKMIVDAHYRMKDVRQNLLKTNAKYKEATDTHCRAKVFKERDNAMVFLSIERFLVWMYRKL